ncbi:tRNA (guanine26-N2/guanine27-N2)-dimethyltransferase, partial [Phenoliferia sp. Uapishka_3]
MSTSAQPMEATPTTSTEAMEAIIPSPAARTQHPTSKECLISPTHPPASKPVPANFVVHTESTTSILFAAPQTTGPAPVFLNPVQEYNRDLSIVAIRTWSEQRQKDKAAAWEKSVRKKEASAKAKAKGKRKSEEIKAEGAKKLKGEEGEPVKVQGGEDKVAELVPVEAEVPETPRVLTPPQFKFTTLEALSATGLRAIRYAKEIPLLRYVVANDLSPSAVEDIRRNIDFNDLAPIGPPTPSDDSTAVPLTKSQLEEAKLGKVRVNAGDACVYMYNHRTDSARFDCVDLDPYGSAVPFLDAAIGSVSDGGLLCVTCTDAAVLAGHNYPEKAYTHYGGVCVNAEYSHEVGIRLILNSIATTAARYGRSIEPLLSLSIDFYMRVFVRITTSPKEVKRLPSKTSLLYYCHDCQMPWMQPMGRQVEKKNAKTGDVQYSYHSPSGPPPGAGDRCGECGGKYHIGGPMWGAPIHDQEFVGEMLELVESNQNAFGTSTRIIGMLTVAKAVCPSSLLFRHSR